MNEVQIVQTSGASHPEVQVIRTYAAPGQNIEGGAFTIQLDTTASGGSIQRSGIIGYNAKANKGSSSDDLRDQVDSILKSMSNIDVAGISSVSRSISDAEGGYSWSVTFSDAMGNVPLMTLQSSSLLGTGADVEITTLQEGNELSGAFTLTVDTSTTSDIAHDARPETVKAALENLDSVGTVDVSRGLRSDQGGYEWTITFTSDTNSGNINTMVATSYLVGEGASVVVIDSIHGNQLGGSFQLKYNDSPTASISFNAQASEVKEKLEAIGEIGAVEVFRSGPDAQLGYSWTISFTKNTGDLLMLDTVTTGLTVSSDGKSMFLTVVEDRKGTQQEVQQIVSSGGLDSSKFFQLKYQSITTGKIYANPGNDGVCLPTDHEAQRIVTTTTDTTSSGGDSIVSSTTAFKLVFLSNGQTETTQLIYANQDQGNCATGASTIKSELEKLNLVIGSVTVTASSSIATQGCTWDVEFTGNSGNLEEMQVIGGSDGPSSSVDFMDDTITISTIKDGTVDVIKTELEKLANIGQVTVTATGATVSGCTWKVTFDTNAGDLSLMEISVDGGEYGASEAITVSQVRPGTSTVLGGDFTLEFDGQRTGYLSQSITADDLQSALEGLTTIGKVDVTRSDVDPNNGYTWTISFKNNLGSLPFIKIDTKGMTGTVPQGSVQKYVTGIYPRFDSLDSANGK